LVKTPVVFAKNSDPTPTPLVSSDHDHNAELPLLELSSTQYLVFAVRLNDVGKSKTAGVLDRKLSASVPIVVSTEPGLVDESLRRDTVIEPPDVGSPLSNNFTSDKLRAPAPLEKESANGPKEETVSAPDEDAGRLL